MILFGLLLSMVGCFFPICYDFFLFWFWLRTRSIGHWTLDFRFISFFIPFHSRYHFCFDFPRREWGYPFVADHRLLPLWDRLITRSLLLVRRVFLLPIVASVVRNTNRGKSWPPRCGIPYTTRSFFCLRFFDITLMSFYCVFFSFLGIDVTLGIFSCIQRRLSFPFFPFSRTVCLVSSEGSHDPRGLILDRSFAFSFCFNLEWHYADRPFSFLF